MPARCPATASDLFGPRSQRSRLPESQVAASINWGSFDRVSCFCCLKGVSKSVQVLFNGIEAVLVLSLILLK